MQVQEELVYLQILIKRCSINFFLYYGLQNSDLLEHDVKALNNGVEGLFLLS